MRESRTRRVPGASSSSRRPRFRRAVIATSTVQLLLPRAQAPIAFAYERTGKRLARLPHLFSCAERREDRPDRVEAVTPEQQRHQLAELGRTTSVDIVVDEVARRSEDAVREEAARQLTAFVGGAGTVTRIACGVATKRLEANVRPRALAFALWPQSAPSRRPSRRGRARSPGGSSSTCTGQDAFPVTREQRVVLAHVCRAERGHAARGVKFCMKTPPRHTAVSSGRRACRTSRAPRAGCRR